MLGEAAKVRIAYCVFRIPSSRYAIRNTEYESRQPGREACSSLSASHYSFQLITDY